MKKAAQIIRILTIPTLVFVFMLLLTKFTTSDIYLKESEFYISLVFLAIIPLLSYPISFIIEKNKDTQTTRKLQRKMAFIFSLVGYLTNFILSYILDFNNQIMIMSYTYFLTVVFLTIVNLFIKASGHAAGIVGPMLLLCNYIGWIYIIPCLFIYALSFWASIYLKRHTVVQFILGTLIAVISFLIPFLIFGL